MHMNIWAFFVREWFSWMFNLSVFMVRDGVFTEVKTAWEMVFTEVKTA